MVDIASRPQTPIHVIDHPSGAAAVMHPLRRRILQQLETADSATGVSKRLGLPRQKVNYHLRQLEAEGLVELVEERRKRNCTERVVRAVARSYLISPETLGSLASDPSRVRDRASSAYLVAVAAELIRDVATMRAAAAREKKKLPTLTMQSEVRFATPEDQSAFAEELSATVADLVAKYHDEAAPGGRSFNLVAGAYPTPRKETS
jgi:DNA-binding transcriptional ArsR family regulator